MGYIILKHTLDFYCAVYLQKINNKLDKVCEMDDIRNIRRRSYHIDRILKWMAT